MGTVWAPAMAPAGRSRRDAFVPGIAAATATRKPTDTMIPSSVKNERSLWLHAVWSAWRIASERGMGLEASAECGIRHAEWRGGPRSAFRTPHSTLFVA